MLTKETVDRVSLEIFGRSASDAIAKGECLSCEERIKDFTNTWATIVYSYYGLCKKCQHDVCSHNTGGQICPTR